MITGASSGISAQFLNPAPSSATKADGLIFDSVLSGMIKGKEPAILIQAEPPVPAETEDSQESTDQEATEQGYLNLYPYRILQDGKAAVSVRNVPTDEESDQTGTWLVSVAEKQQVITGKLGYAAPTETPARPEAFEARTHMESLPVASVQESSPPEASLTNYPDGSATVGKADQTGTGLVSVAEKQPATTDKFNYAVSTAETPARPEAFEAFEARVRIEQLPLSDTAITTSASGSQEDEQASIPESIEISEHGEKKHYPTTVDMRKQQVDFNSAEPDNLFKQEAENNLIADEEHNLELPEAAGKTPNVNENKALMNQGPVIRELAAETVFGYKPSKVTASHIEDIQKTIEMQIEKTPVLGTTVVKILLTPDNIGDIHVQLIKTKDSITAVLHVQDAETKGILEDQLPLLMEPFKHSVSESPLTLTVVADPSLAFSFSEGADPGHRKMERQESRKRTSKEKTETKKNPTTKQSSRGLSVLA
ncbi:flagellar hook-length control protein FliK [Trichococcus shcherbakoviae]|uniref:Flagellar hook-length control protein FliK n=1 Tax=Trichococcus shcherbakoviae subsp. psychrophilus TaxID=2585775 RepID=A0A5C5E5R9_9LACT|nr:flagellar hook-length control protein FliK [Trichococcus shcherbakoviae]TNV68568.1 flagellar hook-length control protein FliK [Trichococcus shcherbakoviae subsp. psychrophilus]